MQVDHGAEIGVGDTAILEFHLKGVQHAIKKAVMMRASGLAELIDAEVNRAFTPDRIQAAIAREVEQQFNYSMSYGEGAQAVRKIVEEQIAKTIAKLAQ